MRSLGVTDPRVRRPELLGFELVEIHRAVLIWNELPDEWRERRINLMEPLSPAEGRALAVLCRSLARARSKAVRFGVETALRAVKDAGTLAEARRTIARYLHGGSEPGRAAADA